MVGQVSEGQKVFECFNLFEQHKPFFENLNLCLKSLQDFSEHPSHGEDFSALQYFNFSFLDSNPFLFDGDFEKNDSPKPIVQITLAQFLIQKLGGDAYHKNGITTIKGIWAAYAYHSLSGCPDVGWSLDTLVRLSDLNYFERTKKLMTARYLDFDEVGSQIITKIYNATNYLKSTWVQEG